MFGDRWTLIVKRYLEKYFKTVKRFKCEISLVCFLVDSFEEIQEEIKFRLDDNTEFFSKNCQNLNQKNEIISSSLNELSIIFELESERMEGSLEKANGFAGELDHVAGDIIELSRERKALAETIENQKQLEIISKKDGCVYCIYLYMYVDR